MIVTISSDDLQSKPCDILVIPVCEDADIYPADFIPKLMQQARALKEFNGADGDRAVFYAPSGIQAAQVMFVGLGPKDRLDAESFRKACGTAVKKCIQKETSTACFVVPDASDLPTGYDERLKAMIEGAYLGNYQYDLFKKPKHSSLETLIFSVPAAMSSQADDLSRKVTAVCDGVILARQWVTTPPNLKRPEQFAEMITSLAQAQHLHIETLDHTALREKGFGALLAAAAGSDVSARMVILEHRPPRFQKTIALAGKGVTFDSGGINLKQPISLEDMKMDMAGAAAVAATLITAARLNLPVRLIGALPIVENMPSGSAIRPGDVVKSFSGKTIEIGNTDAEGRLILADALSYIIQTRTPDVVMDLATLTGACVIGLGEKIAGVFSYDNALAESLVTSGRNTFERCWQMPLPEDYKAYLKSEIADICNKSHSKWGGAITAALFLSEFTQNTRWAHIDIAGPAFIKKGTPYCIAGGTGFGVRLLCDWLEKEAEAGSQGCS